MGTLFLNRASAASCGAMLGLLTIGAMSAAAQDTVPKPPAGVPLEAVIEQQAEAVEQQAQAEARLAEAVAQDAEAVAKQAEAAADAAVQAAPPKALPFRDMRFDAFSPVTPEMAKKTRDIALLRQILRLGLSARDIQAALTRLKEVQSVGKLEPVRPEQVLNEEYDRLLRAKPGDPVPSSSAEALRDSASGYRNRKQAIWDKLAAEIGKTKSDGIRRMLRSEQNAFTVWGLGGPAVISGLTQNNANSDAREVVIDVTRPRASAGDAPGRRVIVKPNTTLVLPPPADGTAPKAPPRVESNQRYRILRDTLTGTFSQPFVDKFFGYTAYNQATLEELIDLFQRKLAAMSR